MGAVGAHVHNSVWIIREEPNVPVPMNKLEALRTVIEIYKKLLILTDAAAPSRWCWAGDKAFFHFTS